MKRLNSGNSLCISVQIPVFFIDKSAQKMALSNHLQITVGKGQGLDKTE